MIIRLFLRAALLTAACLAASAHAMSLGEIVLHSRLGDALYAEIAVAAEDDALDSACFSLGPQPGADLPVIVDARLRLTGAGERRRLIITAAPIINEPAFILSVRAGCGANLQRDYVLLPTPHEGLPESPARPDETPATTLEPHRLDRSERLAASKPTARKAGKGANSAHLRRLPKDTLAGLASGRDRIVLGSAPDTPATSQMLTDTGALQQRLLKMETTLHRLNQQIDTLGAALALESESHAIRERLATLQVGHEVPVTAPAINERRANGPRWLELFLGIMLGGGVSAGLAYWIGRRELRCEPIAIPPK